MVQGGKVGRKGGREGGREEGGRQEGRKCNNKYLPSLPIPIGAPASEQNPEPERERGCVYSPSSAGGVDSADKLSW